MNSRNRCRKTNKNKNIKVNKDRKGRKRNKFTATIWLLVVVNPFDVCWPQGCDNSFLPWRDVGTRCLSSYYLPNLFTDVWNLVYSPRCFPFFYYPLQPPDIYDYPNYKIKFETNQHIIIPHRSRSKYGVSERNIFIVRLICCCNKS